MRFRTLAGAALLTGAAVLTACSTSSQSSGPSTQPPAMTSAMAPAMSKARTGTFMGLNDKHVAGAVKIADGQVALADFSTDPGPDLHVYLTNGTDENAVTAGKALGTVALDKAAQTFSTSGVDTSQYTTVVIHCDKAKAVFGAATLT